MVAEHLSLTPLSTVPKLLGSDRQGSSGRFQENATGLQAPWLWVGVLVAFLKDFFWLRVKWTDHHGGEGTFVDTEVDYHYGGPAS